MELSEHAISFWSVPHKTALRRWIFQTHFYAALFSGLVLTMLGLTGSLIVFIPELRRLEVPGATRVVPNGTPVPLEILCERFHQRRPGDTLISIYSDFKPTWALDFVSRTPNGDRIHTFVDPFTGTFQISYNYSHRFLQTIFDLHANLLAGPTGRIVNGWFAVIFGLGSTTGLFLWWRGSRHWREGLRYNRRAGWKRRNWDLHNVGGFLFYLPLLLLSLTGIYYGFIPQTKHFVAFATRSPSEIAPPPVPIMSTPPAPVDTMVAIARRTIPDAALSVVVFPAKPGAPYAIRMRRPSDLHRIGLNWIYFDPATARVLRVDLFEHQPIGVKIIRLMAPIHYGAFWGLPTRLLWVLVGLVPGALFGTGLVLWWNRSLARRIAKRQ
jgi:uncharacterized iron-regulated membrane protein